ncbi:MAG: LPS assembly protein LptD [Planctomycetota bacterium]|nr:LPS assembly protein LptD [Planctomycetota bacterium]
MPLLRHVCNFVAACCLACAATLAPAILAGEGEAPAPAEPPAPVMVAGVRWNAVQQTLMEDKGAVILSGSAWVEYTGVRLEADHIVYFQKTKEVYAEGNIRLRAGESEAAAQVAYVDIANDRGYLVDAVVRVSMPAAEEKPASPLDLPKPRSLEEGFTKVEKGEASLLRSRDPYGVYLDVVDDPQGRLNFIFKAEKVVYESRMHLRADDAFVTTDDMADPMYGVKIKHLDMFMREIPDPTKPGRTDLRPRLIVGRGARLKIGPVTLFPFPTVNYDLTKHLGFVAVDAGNSSQWGAYGLFRYGMGLNTEADNLFDPVKLYLDIDYRVKRGPALGGEFKYQTGRRPQSGEARQAFERGRGFVRVYFSSEMSITGEDDYERARRNRERRIQPKIDGDHYREYDANQLFLARRRKDNAGPPSFDLDYYEGETRGIVDFAHHQPLRFIAGLNDVELDFKYQWRSDRDYELDYFSNNYLQNNQPEALASVRKGGDNYALEALFRANPHDFDGAPPRAPYDFGTFTEYQPALTASLVPTGLGKGFYAEGQAQLARLRRDFENSVIEQDDLEASRGFAKATIQRPTRFAGLNFRPYFGGQAAWYDDSRDGGDTVQGAFLYGMDVSTRLYAALPEARNGELGLYGFRHVIEPRIEWSAVSDTIEDPVNIYDFDAVDDLIGLQRIRFALDQKFQTRTVRKDGTLGTRDFATFRIHTDLFPRQADRDRLLEGDHLDLLYLTGNLFVIDAIQLQGNLGVNMENGAKAEVASFFLNFDPGGRWRLELSERYNFNDDERKIQGSDFFRVKFDFQLSERWTISIEEATERQRAFLARKGRSYTRLALSRRYGALVGTFSYRVDKNNKDSSVGFSLAPAFAYRNLIVPNQSLLVASAESEGGDEFPEERNFDPFNLVKKHAKKKKAPPQQPVVPPPPPAEPVEPPPPPPSNDGGASREAEAPVATAARPAEPVQLKQPPRNLDSDDWAAEGAPGAGKPSDGR